MSTSTKGGPTTKASRTNQRAILDTPVKAEAPPERKKGGRKSKLAPIVESLKADPGQWYRVATGKTGTIYQTCARLRKGWPELEVSPTPDEKDEGISHCVARMPVIEDK